MNVTETFCLTDVSYTYSAPGRPDHPVLKHLSLEVHPGEVFVVISPGGEGKSTLLRVMAGLLAPQEGSVKIQGVDIYRSPHLLRDEVLRRIGMTFERGGIFDFLDTEGNLLFPLRERGHGDQIYLNERVSQSLKEVGLLGSERKKVNELSGGMIKRLGIARALILNPDIALYDDPTAGLDPITSRAIVNLLLEMKAHYAMTTVAVTSDLSLAFHLADRLGVLYQGKFLQIGDVDTIKKSTHPVVQQFVRGLDEGPLTLEYANS